MNSLATSPKRAGTGGQAEQARGGVQRALPETGDAWIGSSQPSKQLVQLVQYHLWLGMVVQDVGRRI